MAEEAQSTVHNEPPICTTRKLIVEGHNLTLRGGELEERGGCSECESRICNYIGQVCGCGAELCVDFENGIRKRGG